MHNNFRAEVEAGLGALRDEHGHNGCLLYTSRCV